MTLHDFMTTATTMQQRWCREIPLEPPVIGEWLGWVRKYTDDELIYAISVTASAYINKSRNKVPFSAYDALRYLNSILYKNFGQDSEKEDL